MHHNADLSLVEVDLLFNGMLALVTCIMIPSAGFDYLATTAHLTVESSTVFAEMEGANAVLVMALEELIEVKKDTTRELMATLEYIQSLHTECDWLLKYFDVRREARTGEIDTILIAKAVLCGADYSFLQVWSHRFLQGSP